MQYFLDEGKKLKGIGVAYVTSALPLREEQKKQVEAKLLETTAFKEMEMHYQEDGSLIGGMVIRIGDRVADSSIRTNWISCSGSCWRFNCKNHEKYF